MDLADSLTLIGYFFLSNPLLLGFEHAINTWWDE